MDTTGIETETFFAQTPSHPARSTDLVDADEQRSAAWQEYDWLIENREALEGKVGSDKYWLELNAAEAAAVEAEAWYKDCWERWNKERAAKLAQAVETHRGAEIAASLGIEMDAMPVQDMYL